MTPEELVNALANKDGRNETIRALVGGLTATELRHAQVSPEARAALIAGLEHPNAKVRWWCLQLMDHLADESYLQPILAKLAEPVAKVRRHAIHALVCDACKPDRCRLDIDIVATLRDVALNDPDSKVRWEAHHGAAALESSRSAPPGQQLGSEAE